MMSINARGWPYKLNLRTSIEDLDADFVRAGRFDFDLFDFERLASAPADGGFALDDFAGSVGHDERIEYGKKREGVQRREPDTKVSIFIYSKSEGKSPDARKRKSAHMGSKVHNL